MSPPGVVQPAYPRDRIATVYPFLYARLGYYAAVDLQAVSLAAETTLGLAVGPAVPPEVAALADFIDRVRRHPNAANIGSPGTGTLPRLLEAVLFHNADSAWALLDEGGHLRQVLAAPRPRGRQPAATAPHRATPLGKWSAFFAPGGTSNDTIASRSIALQQAIARPAVHAAFAQAGMTPTSSSPSSLVTQIELEQRYWQPVLRANGIHAD